MGKNSTKTPKKCQEQNCNKKIKLMPYKCRCELYFCVNHINSEVHDCSYDYRANRDISGIIESMRCVGTQIEPI